MVSKRYESLSAALDASSYPSINKQFALRVLGSIAFTEVVETTGYLSMVRSDGRRPLRLHRSELGGFESLEEGREITGLDEVMESVGRKGTWYVKLPDYVPEIGGGVASGKRPSRELGVCGTHGMQLDVAGACSYCD